VYLTTIRFGRRDQLQQDIDVAGDLLECRHSERRQTDHALMAATIEHDRSAHALQKAFASLDEVGNDIALLARKVAARNVDHIKTDQVTLAPE